ncbi:hypothetical protein DPX16_15862 [Anabarilius grahami]|uniref:Uncharacterized protein n=1 Tax=Anabarilius grahami TaxID=495550 RepID=A0A3N0YTM0_ANAGA|nr:hypothetical protein DPX16_15862 [Anabarilius grahami]
MPRQTLLKSNIDGAYDGGGHKVTTDFSPFQSTEALKSQNLCSPTHRQLANQAQHHRITAITCQEINHGTLLVLTAHGHSLIPIIPLQESCSEPGNSNSHDSSWSSASRGACNHGYQGLD